jgi:hypothetical protein
MRMTSESNSAMTLEGTETRNSLTMGLSYSGWANVLGRNRMEGSLLLKPAIGIRNALFETNAGAPT